MSLFGKRNKKKPPQKQPPKKTLSFVNFAEEYGKRMKEEQRAALGAYPPLPDPLPKADYEGLVVWLKAYLEKHRDTPRPAFLDTTQSSNFILGRNQSQKRQSFLDYLQHDPTGKRINIIIRRWQEEYVEVNTSRDDPMNYVIPPETHNQIRDQFERVYGEALGDDVIQSQAARDRHTYIIGKSGSGKTTLLLNMIYQDLKAGNGLGVIAPEQEMITEQILPFIPEERLDDVIYFNPADENPIAFNPLNLEAGEDPGLKANEVMTIFQRIIGAESTPRIGQILYQTFHALIMTPNTTLLDIRKLLNRDNPEFRQQIISQIEDEECIEFWRDDYPQYPKEAHLPILYRVSPFTRDKRVRNTLCQTGQNLNFRQVMDSGKIILFNLSDGILGEATSQLFGQLIVSQIQQAAISRANIPEQERRRFYLYIDEFQTFTNTATSSYEKILSRARKYKLALILAHQQTGQIPRELLMDIFGNVSTMVCFMISHNDATKFSKEFIVQGQPLPPEKFIELEVGETFCKLGKESFKMKTPLVTQKPNWDIKEKIIEQSRKQFISDTPTPTTSKPKPPEQPEQPAPDEPLITKPKIKPTGKIK